MQIKINKTKGSIIEVEGLVSWVDFSEYQAKALTKLGEGLSLPGFRPGHIPENILLKNITDSAILDEMAQQFLASNYPTILIENKIDAIGHPEVTLTKLARDNDFEFKLKTAVLPEVILPDYREIAKKVGNVEEIKVTDEEIENTILELRKMRAPKVDHEGCEGEKCEHKEVLPEFNDDFVKTLGAFENVEDFKKKLVENIQIEKNNKEREKRRIKIVEDIVKDSKIDLPDILIESELDKMLYRLQMDAEGAGVVFEDYLKQVNKTSEEIRKEWRDSAEKRVRAELVIAQIAKSESIKPTESDIETEVSRLLEMYKDADKDRSKAYVESVLKNEKVFQFLENLI